MPHSTPNGTRIRSSQDGPNTRQNPAEAVTGTSNPGESSDFLSFRPPASCVEKMGKWREGAFMKLEKWGILIDRDEREKRGDLGIG
jgi:hypothetical protein